MKKTTLATLKSFIKKNEKNLYVKVQEQFGREEYYTIIRNSQEFNKVEKYDLTKQYDFGIKGLWLVGTKSNYIEKWENEEYTGLRISNCCGISIIAIKK